MDLPLTTFKHSGDLVYEAGDECNGGSTELLQKAKVQEPEDHL